MADSTQPALIDQNLPRFNTDEVLWYKNGIWGDAGYAIPNPLGKTLTSNGDIFDLHATLGRVMFELLHQEDIVSFSRPPTRKQWLYDLHQMCVVGRKRLADLTRMPNDGNGLDVQHAKPNKRQFVVYPVPYFGGRIRNADVQKYATIAMLCLSEIMQQTDNDIVGYVTPTFTSQIGKYLQEILAQMSMKFFGYSRAEAYKPDFALKDEDFAKYDPSKLMLNVEMTEERPPDQWWPTTNDLSLIRNLPINKALLLAERWPSGPTLYSGDASQWPGAGKAGSDPNTNPGGTVSGQATGDSTTTSFIPNPNAAP